jgi:hypothetical protein
MPRTTVKYPFEWRMLQGAIALAAKHGGSDMTEMLFDVAGDKVHLGGDLRARREALEAQGGAHLYYDPFDPPEYRWLSWHGLPRDKAESLLGVRFEAGDFVEESYPESWGVMF